MIDIHFLQPSLLFNSGKILVILVFASACGGTYTPAIIIPTPIDNSAPLMFAKLNSVSIELTSRVQGENFSQLSSLPTAGTATYSGVVEMREIAGSLKTQAIIGAATIELLFAKTTPQFSGAVTSLFIQTGEQIQGQLAISNGQLERTGDPAIDRTLTAYLSGLVTFPDESVTDYNLILEGDLIGNRSQFAAGGILGVATNRGETSQIVGKFILEN